MSLLKNAILLGVGAFLGYETLRALSIQQMVFSLDDLAVNQTGLETDVTLNIAAANPTNFTNTLDGFTGSLFVNEQFLGDVFVTQPIDLVKGQTTRVPISVKLSDLSLVSVLLEMIAGGSSEAVAELKGEVRVDRLPYPVDLFYRVV